MDPNLISLYMDDVISTRDALLRVPYDLDVLSQAVCHLNTLECILHYFLVKEQIKDYEQKC